MLNPCLSLINHSEFYYPERYFPSSKLPMILGSLHCCQIPKCSQQPVLDQAYAKSQKLHLGLSHLQEGLCVPHLLLRNMNKKLGWKQSSKDSSQHSNMGHWSCKRCLNLLSQNAGSNFSFLSRGCYQHPRNMTSRFPIPHLKSDPFRFRV